VPVASGGPVRTTPPVRKLARDLNVPLESVHPTGKNGRITREDVHAAAERGHADSVHAEAGSPDIRVPIRSSRRHIAEAMVRSAFTAPHVTEWMSVDLTKSLKLVRHLRERHPNAPVKATLLHLVARACVLTLTRYPDANASWDGDAGEIVQHQDVNLGIAVASPRGLIVPNIRRAQAMNFAELSEGLAQLILNARANKTTVHDMQGGTFTVTNIGVFGVDGGTPILNPGESAILALGRTQRIPWNHKGKVRLRDVGTLSLAFDHRLVDGELGSRVLANIGELLEYPERALIQ
jgi:pyruvate dehydrogenase E2 component (dihydrolipoamide acetyltransferase)